MAYRIAVFNHLPEILERFRHFFELNGFIVATFQQEIGTLPEIIPFAADIIVLGHARGYPTNYPEFIQALRDDPLTATLPIIVCTTSEIAVTNEEGQEKIQYISIGPEALNMEHVLIGVRLALNPGSGSEF